MKLYRRRLFLFLSIILLSIGSSLAQSFDMFMRNYGGEVIADIAHPSNTYKGCTYETKQDKLYVTVSYEEGYQTRVVISAKGPIFHSLEVISDSDFFPPFLASYGLKNALYEALSRETPELIQEIESVLGSSIREMDGRQLCCAMLTISFLKYYAKYHS